MPGFRKEWDENDMVKALAEIDKGISIRKAAKNHGMSEANVRRRIKMKVNGLKIVGSGRKRALSEETENELAQCIKLSHQIDPSITLSDVREIVKEYIEVNGICNSFKDNRPGKHWLARFKKTYDLNLNKEKRTKNGSTTKRTNQNDDNDMISNSMDEEVEESDNVSKNTNTSEKLDNVITPTSSTAQFHEISDSHENSENERCTCFVCKILGTKPSPIKGKIWVPVWGLQEEPSNRTSVEVMEKHISLSKDNKINKKKRKT